MGATCDTGISIYSYFKAIDELTQFQLTEKNVNALLKKAVEITREALHCQHVYLLYHACVNSVSRVSPIVVHQKNSYTLFLDNSSDRHALSLLGVDFIQEIGEQAVIKNIPPGIAELRQYEFQSSITMPFNGYSEDLVLLSAFSKSQHHFTLDDANFLRIVSNILANAVVQSELIETKEVERKQACQIKHECEGVFNTLPQLICLLDKRLNIIRVNRSVETWGLGTVESVVGLNIHRLLHGGSCDQCYVGAFISNAQQKLARNEFLALEFRDKFHNKEVHLDIRRIDIEKNRFQQASNDPYAVLVIDDISQHSRIEKLLRVSNEELEEQVKKRTVQLSNVNENLRIEIKRYEQVEYALKKYEQELQLLSGELLTAQEKERQRIALELHDSIGQSMSAVKFRIEKLAGTCDELTLDQRNNEFASIVNNIRDAIEETRRISMDLRPSILDDLGIVATIGWFCREYRGMQPNIGVTVDIGVEENEIDDKIKIVIFRILQESVNNIVKHAKASKISVMLNKINGNVCLRVRDNGVGFDRLRRQMDYSTRSGMGLAGMSERAERSGGRFSIITDINKGVITEASWPLREPIHQT